MLSFDKLLGTDYATVSIRREGVVNFIGILQNDIGLSGRNNFDTGFLGSSVITGALEKKAEIQRTVTYITGGEAGGDISGTVPELTRNNWIGSERPSFNIQVALVALKDDEKNSVIRMSNEIMKAVFPDKRGGLFTAPLRYNPGNADGTVTLNIGRWFSASRLVVVSADFTHSRVTLRSGRPLYALGSITLQPYQAITYREYISYFRVS